MSFENKTNCFCYKYLSEKSGIELKTIQIMIDNGFDSVHSLLAVRVDTDLNQIPELLLGQKSILREALQDLQNEYKELKLKLKIDNSFTRRLLEDSLINDDISTKNDSQNVVKTIEDKIQTISEKLGLKSAKKQKKVTNGDQNITSSEVIEPEIITSGTAFSAQKCDVCGRPAETKRCRQKNGTVCVQCLHFYRYHLQTNNQLVCNSEDNCVIDKNIKSNCRRCRWIRCLEIICMANEETKSNDSKNGVKNANKSSERSAPKVSLPSASTIKADEEYFQQFMETTDYVNKSQPYISLTPIKLSPKQLNQSKSYIICKVCSDQVTKNKTNYGVVTCSACASFFLRVNKKQIIITECIKSDKCLINPKTRNQCKSCRYQACHMSGMIYTSKHKDNGTEEEEESFDENQEQEKSQEEEDEEVSPNYSSEISTGTDFNYTLIRCGRIPDSPMNQKNPKRVKNKI